MAKPTRYTPDMAREFYKSGQWLPFTLSDLWEKNSELYPHWEAVVDSKRRFTWREANLAIDRLALSFLKLGFRKDELLVLQLPNCVELVLLRVACEKAGILCLPILRNLRHREVKNILDRVKAKGIAIPLTWRDFDYLGMIKELKPELPDLQYIMVSGDTAPPGTLSITEFLSSPAEKHFPRDHLKKNSLSPRRGILNKPHDGHHGFP